MSTFYWIILGISGAMNIVTGLFLLGLALWYRGVRDAE